jgi:hypothetical protein
MAQFEPPPTYSDVIIQDEKTGKGVFNPLWLRWFLDLASFVKAPSGGGTAVSLLDDSTSILSNRAFSEYPRTAFPPAPDAANELAAVIVNRSFVLPVSLVAPSANDTQNMLATQIFGG